MLQVLNCADLSGIIDQAIVDLRESGAQFDEQCVRDALAGVDASQFASGDIPEAVSTDLAACVTG